MCELCFYLGEFRNSCDHRDKCISLYRKSEHIQLARELGDDPVVIASMYKALSLWFLGFPDKAIAVCREGLSLAYELKHAFTIAQAEFYAAWLHAYLRDYETAEQHATRAIKNCDLHGYSMYLGLSRVIYGWAMTMRGGHKQGETEIKEGLDLIRGPNADVCESCFLLFFAEHSLLLGENERGLSIIQEAKTVASERFAEPERTRIEAELRAGENKEIAEQGFLKALDLARKQESLSLELRVALSLCRLLSEANRAGEGMRILKDVYERFTEGFKTCDLRVARTELKLGG
jgi:adenylate cyclase